MQKLLETQGSQSKVHELNIYIYIYIYIYIIFYILYVRVFGVILSGPDQK